MLDIGWTELLLVGIVALIVVGPKDLPGMFRTLGKVTARLRSMARDFQRSLEEAADETGVKDVASDLRSAASARNMGLDKVKEAATNFDSWKTRDEVKSDAADAAEGNDRGTHTSKLAEDRAEAARKIHERTAQAARERRAAEAEQEHGADTADAPAADKPAKPAAKSGGTRAKTARAKTGAAGKAKAGGGAAKKSSSTARKTAAKSKASSKADDAS